MLVRDVRRVRLHFVFVMHKLRTVGNVGKKGKKGNIWLAQLMMSLKRGGGILFNGTRLIYYDVKTIKILIKVRPELPTSLIQAYQ